MKRKRNQKKVFKNSESLRKLAARETKQNKKKQK